MPYTLGYCDNATRWNENEVARERGNISSSKARRHPIISSREDVKWLREDKKSKR